MALCQAYGTPCISQKSETSQKCSPGILIIKSIYVGCSQNSFLIEFEKDWIVNHSSHVHATHILATSYLFYVGLYYSFFLSANIHRAYSADQNFEITLRETVTVFYLPIWQMILPQKNDSFKCFGTLAGSYLRIPFNTRHEFAKVIVSLHTLPILP